MTAQQNPEIEKIIKAHYQEQEIQFLIKWKGLEDSHNCWLGQKTLSKISPALLFEYLKQKETKQEEFFKEYECKKNEDVEKLQQSCNYITVKQKVEHKKQSEIDRINLTIKKIQKEQKGPSIVKRILLHDIIEDQDMCLIELEYANGETTKELMETKEIKKQWIANFIEFQSQKVAFLGKLKKEIEEEGY